MPSAAQPRLQVCCPRHILLGVAFALVDLSRCDAERLLWEAARHEYQHLDKSALLEGRDRTQTQLTAQVHAEQRGVAPVCNGASFEGRRVTVGVQDGTNLFLQLCWDGSLTGSPTGSLQTTLFRSKLDGCSPGLYTV